MSGPDPMWARPQPALGWLLPLLAALTFAFAAALTASARADETVPTATAGDVLPTPIEQPGDQGTQADPGPVPVDPPPQLDPQPQSDPPPPPPEAQQPPVENPPAAPADVHPQAVLDRGGGDGHVSTTQGASPSAGSAPATFTTAPQSPATHVSAPAAPATTAPLGWDVYDDAVFAEMIDGNGNSGSGATGFGGGVARAIGGLGVMGAAAHAAQRDKTHDAKRASSAEPMSSGGSGPGGSGPGQGPSLGLFGAAGGSSAGMALLTLLGMASAWFLMAPDRTRAFLTSTATWRLSNYVPPIERPG